MFKFKTGDIVEVKPLAHKKLKVKSRMFFAGMNIYNVEIDDRVESFRECELN